MVDIAIVDFGAATGVEAVGGIFSDVGAAWGKGARVG